MPLSPQSLCGWCLADGGRKSVAEVPAGMACGPQLCRRNARPAIAHCAALPEQTGTYILPSSLQTMIWGDHNPPPLAIPAASPHPHKTNNWSSVLMQGNQTGRQTNRRFQHFHPNPFPMCLCTYSVWKLDYCSPFCSRCHFCLFISVYLCICVCVLYKMWPGPTQK